jgi:molybdopterin synthase sulfur carrier subunit
VAKVRLKVVSWLSRTFTSFESSSREWDEEVEAGTTVRDLFDRLAAENPDFARHVFDRSTRQLMGHVNVIFNDRILELVNGLDTEINDGDTLTLLPAYAGGRRADPGNRA